ncbi:beta-cystathionase [Paenibacillus larvae subsp. pulvifaciens]|uniref:cysteine-S-conjugate beta-lyase n=1 Tax=Paenibacillus larvae subsp. pulvifaciens TaxID=1477 RepID=A0A1V0URH5_9BACL|nr:MalY/PatB family protein [Paenibacillus larvae]ARF67717.1 beta-cystathionase [Paenibacillus larvae subsp. pulvifaciens]
MKTIFDKVLNRKGTFCTQWDYIEDRFGEKDLLPFSISDMDFRSPPEIIQALEERLHHGVFGYTRWNHMEFKSAIQYWFRRRFACTVQADWIVYSPSVIYTVSRLIHQLTDPGDHIVIQTPAYDAFFKVIQDNGRNMSCNDLKIEQGRYTIDFDDLERKLADPKAKLFLLCSPHNPTGRVWSQEELARMLDLCRAHRVFVVSDEIHMDIVHGPGSHIPVVKAAESTDHVCLCTSASKTFNTPGLGGSYAFIPNPSVREKFLLQLKNQDGLSSASIFGMLATIRAYSACEEWADQLRAYLYHNLRMVEQFLRQHLPDLSFTLPESTYLAWIDVSDLGFSSEELQEALVHKAKVAIMRGEVYGEAGRGFLRMNVGCPRVKVQEGLRRLKKAVDELKGCSR